MRNLRKRKRKMICVFAAARSEYELLRTVIFRLKKEHDVKIILAGMSLSSEYGQTIDDIHRDGLSIYKRVETLPGAEMAAAVSKSMALALLGFADSFAEWDPDLLVVLGDRHETLAVCCAAANQGVPIAHISGGETASGSVEEPIRHAITKMSYLHFAGTETYRQRIVQMGEEPNRVFTVGMPAMEKILQTGLLSKETVSKSLGLDLNKPYALVAFQPALEEISVPKQFSQVLRALRKHRDLNYAFIQPEAGLYGQTITVMMDKFIKTHRNAVGLLSLGREESLGALKYAAMIIGNSANGIYEAPILRVPTINIGDRQKGRLQSGSVINCPIEAEAISEAIQKAQDPQFLKNMEYRSALYGDGESSRRIVGVIEDFLSREKMSTKKEFYDLL